MREVGRGLSSRAYIGDVFQLRLSLRLDKENEL